MNLLKISLVLSLVGASVSASMAAPKDPGPVTYTGSACVEPSCNNPSGCITGRPVYEVWHSHGVCKTAAGSSGGSNCTETWRLCYENYYYPGITGCNGEITGYTSFKEYGC